MMMDNEQRYILITPAKNEEKDLPIVAESIIRQSILPKLWIIVDDGSTDNTPQIINNLKNSFEWIISLRLPQHPRDITFHYSYVCKNGFDNAIEYCHANNIEYGFVGLLDADTVLEEKYFEKLFQEFNKDKRLGIASGHIIDLTSDPIHWDTVKRDWPDSKMPRGSGRLWRGTCFFETGGYLVEPSPDSISNIKAHLRGWKIAQFGHVIAIQKRQTSGAEGLWKGYFINGGNAYYLNKHPLLVLLGSIHYSCRKPYYHGLAYLNGYILMWCRHSEKIKDQEIRDYYWNNRLQEYLSRKNLFK